MEDIQKIRAKSVVKNKFWILQQNNNKVGQAKKNNNVIEVKINGNSAGKYTSMSAMKESGLFEFVELPKPAATVSEDVLGYKTDRAAFNAVWNVKYKLPLYTQASDSKSWFAAGYYKVNINGTWIVQFCPKLITLQRNEYDGPFYTTPGLNQFNDMFE